MGQHIWLYTYMENSGIRMYIAIACLTSHWIYPIGNFHHTSKLTPLNPFFYPTYCGDRTHHSFSHPSQLLPDPQHHSFLPPRPRQALPRTAPSSPSNLLAHVPAVARCPVAGREPADRSGRLISLIRTPRCQVSTPFVVGWWGTGNPAGQPLSAGWWGRKWPGRRAGRGAWLPHWEEGPAWLPHWEEGPACGARLQTRVPRLELEIWVHGGGSSGCAATAGMVRRREYRDAVGRAVADGRQPL
jgi:hypothetical protein